MTRPSTQPATTAATQPEPYLVAVVVLNGRWIVACGACRDVVDEHDQEPTARALAARHTEHHHEVGAA